jgi:hypothetical protein
MTSNLPPMPNTPPAPAPKMDPKRRRNLIIAAITVAVLLVAGGTYWLTRPSYNDKVEDCQKALAQHLPESKAEKPDACDGVKADDYLVLFMNQSMDNEGWLDEDGNFDKNKMLEDTLEDQP